MISGIPFVWGPGTRMGDPYVYAVFWVPILGIVLEIGARKLEQDRPLVPTPINKENQHKSSYIHVPSFWSLL